MSARRWLAAASACLCLLGGIPAAAASAAAESRTTADSTYADYQKHYADAARPGTEICVAGGTGQASDPAAVTAPTDFAGRKNTLKWEKASGAVTWTFTVEKAGLYSLELTYYPLEGKGQKPEYTLGINGAVPFSGAAGVTLDRCWQDGLSEADAFEQDVQGNEIAPEPVEQAKWMTKTLADPEGLYTEPYRFYFGSGSNTVTLTCVREQIAVGQLRLYQPEEPPAYAAPSGTDGAPSGYIFHIQAERPSAVSDSSLRPYADKSDPANEPFDAVADRLNSFGGSDWSTAGQWAEWTFTVPADGYYQLTFRYRQNAVRGLFTSRRITVDGAVPYAEMEAVPFRYTSGWSLMTLGGDEPIRLYLTAGQTHTLRLEVTLGESAPILRELQDCRRKLNAYYRRIVMITGTNPDRYRDYQLTREIPELMDTFRELSARLRGQAQKWESLSGFSGSEAVLLYRIAEQLDSFRDAPYSITERLSNLRENIAGMASWLTERQSQPLELDYVAVMAADAKPPAASAGFFRKLWAGVQAFLASFFTDYTHIGSADGDALEVWMGTGSDQMAVLRRLIDRDFTPKQAVPVELKLVSSTLLLQAIMAGVGPDVALNVERTQPVNLALRGALEPLDGYAGFSPLPSRFISTAFDPYTLEGHVYALPETQAFPMLFYRKDILEELSAEVPQTWEDIYRLAPILQRHHMEIGLPTEVYTMLLLQHGGQMYNAGKTALALTEEVSVSAFEEWVAFYTQYTFSLFKDDYNRFRTGEMPLTIMSYTFYCQLAIAAPEIRGLWGMTEVPGVRRADGTIDRTVSALSTGTAAVLLSDSRKKTEGFAFLDWWTSDDIQAAFGREVEAVVGTAARYASANQAAVSRLPWSDAEWNILHAQWKNVRDLPEVPGGYYVTRNIDNAFRACVYRGENPREMLLKWTAETNKEISRKRREYGLT